MIQNLNFNNLPKYMYLKNKNKQLAIALLSGVYF